MLLYFSGGSPIVEVTLPEPHVMLSWFVDVKPKTGKTSKRMTEIMRLRAESRTKERGKKK